MAWHSRKQQMISLSTAEAESHAMVDIAKEMVFVKRMVSAMKRFCYLKVSGKPAIFTDNQPALDAIVNGKGRTKHYDLRIKYLALGIAAGNFEINKVSSRENIADIFTKALRTTRFRWLVRAVVFGAN